MAPTYDWRDDPVQRRVDAILGRAFLGAYADRVRTPDDHNDEETEDE